MTGLEVGLGLAGLAGAAFSARFAWWSPLADGLPILMYHKVGPAPKGSPLPDLWVTPEDFAWQMRRLAAQGFNAVGLADLEAARVGKRRLPQKPVVITFDDGYQNNYIHAFPVLQETGMKAVIFLVHESLGKHNHWHDPAREPWQRMLTWAHIKEMADSGLVDFANHTMNHAHLLQVPLEQAAWEVREAKARLEDKLGKAMPAFAYPYGEGAFDPRIRDAVREAGHTLDFSVRHKLAPFPPADHKLSEPLDRLYIRGRDTRLDFILNLTRGRSRPWKAERW